MRDLAAESALLAATPIALSRATPAKMLADGHPDMQRGLVCLRCLRSACSQAPGRAGRCAAPILVKPPAFASAPRPGHGGYIRLFYRAASASRSRKGGTTKSMNARSFSGRRFRVS
jgi:hypothetical protein